MAKTPAFQFYPKDWLSDAKVRAMTHEERGVYVDLISLCWLEEGLPRAPERLARLVGVSQRRFAKLWPAIAPCFHEAQDTLQQKRLNEEREKQAAFRARQQKNAKKSAKSKEINQSDEPRLSQTGAKPEPNQSFPSAVSSLQSPSPSADAALSESRLRCGRLIRRIVDQEGGHLDERQVWIDAVPVKRREWRGNLNIQTADEDVLLLAERALRERAGPDRSRSPTEEQLFPFISVAQKKNRDKSDAEIREIALEWWGNRHEY